MKQGITITGNYDWHDRRLITVNKRRGKLTVEEIAEALRYSEDQIYCGHYVIILNCSEATIGGSGYFFDDVPQGDAVDLYPVEEGEYCPVCGKFTPPFDFCPTCGTRWRDCENNAEKLLEGMRQESEREIKKASTEAGRLAWYWAHVGALDMARQLGLITEERRQELYNEFKQLKPTGGEA